MFFSSAETIKKTRRSSCSVKKHGADDDNDNDNAAVAM